MAKKEIFLEEAVLDDLSEGLEIVEKPLSEGSFKLVGWVALLAVLIVAGHLVYTQIVKGSAYQSRALANTGQQEILRAPRGIIYDRYGSILVSNEPSFGVILNLSVLLKDRSALDSILQSISEAVPFDVEAVKNEVLSADVERQAYVPLAQNISLAQVIELKKLNSPAVAIENNYSRNYVDGPVFSQIMGYTGFASPQDLSESGGIDLSDYVGKSGVEASYDRYLRGRNGVAVTYKDAKGNIIETKTISDPTGGDSVILTIDAGLQRFFYGALKDQLANLGRVGGAGLVMDPATGEILSLVSLPSFDNNNLTANLFSDKNKPTFNRVISGVYSPGSTIKPLVAFGALEENIIDPLKKILSIGYIEIPNPYFPDKPSRFLDWRPQGWVDMRAALARSSNIYFYEVGGGFTDQSQGAIFGGVSQAGLGINQLQEYWKRFFLDQKTGVDLPGEATGVLADPATREKQTGQPWRIGDTYNVAIGQGDLRITPIELLRYISTMANKGGMPTPFIVSSAKDSSGHIVYQARERLNQIDDKDNSHFDIVQQGMLDGVRKDYGTSYTLSDIPMTIAAKTGSAQIQNNQKVNAFFVGYNIPQTDADYTRTNAENDSSGRRQSASSQRESAPRQIAVLVLIEDAKEGSLNAVPIAKKVFQWYYSNRIIKN